MKDFEFEIKYEIYKVEKRKINTREYEGLDKLKDSESDNVRESEKYLSTIIIPVTNDEYRYRDIYDIKDKEALRLAFNMYPDYDLKIKKVESQLKDVN